MLEEKINRWKKVIAGVSIAAIGAYTATMTSCSSDIEQKTKNNKAYVFTVNPYNQKVLEKIGWTKSPRKTSDYSIFNGSIDEINRELKAKDYSILAITGHHYKTEDNIFGNYGRGVKFDDLPSSKTIETVILSACSTAGTDEETIKNVYKPLIKKFPNLKAITGFKSKSLDNDGCTPKLLLSTSKYLPKSTEEYAKRSVNMNPDRIGTLVRVDKHKWDYHSKDGVYQIKIN